MLAHVCIIAPTRLLSIKPSTCALKRHACAGPPRTAWLNGKCFLSKCGADPATRVGCSERDGGLWYPWGICGWELPAGLAAAFRSGSLRKLCEFPAS